MLKCDSGFQVESELSNAEMDVGRGVSSDHPLAELTTTDEVPVVLTTQLETL